MSTKRWPAVFPAGAAALLLCLSQGACNCGSGPAPDAGEPDAGESEGDAGATDSGTPDAGGDAGPDGGDGDAGTDAGEPPLAYEGFDYPLAAHLLGQDGGSGWSGSWTITCR